MSIRAHLFVALLAGAAVLAAAPAQAQVTITQAKALAGNVTPGDQPGFPVTLSVDGSYAFAGSLTVPAGVNGIEITTFDVSIDMNGFFIAGGGTALKGMVGSQRGATIENGTVIFFSDGGIDGGDFWIIRNMRVVSNDGFAAVDCDDSCHVEGSIIAGNDFQGLDSQDGNGAAIGNVIANNGGQGVASGGAGLGNNALILNDGNRAGNTGDMHPNFCRSTGGLGSC